ncbi:hypothetical protein FQN49_004227, partial [Arthroderma sp. PD_2]
VPETSTSVCPPVPTTRRRSGITLPETCSCVRLAVRSPTSTARDSISASAAPSRTTRVSLPLPPPSTHRSSRPSRPCTLPRL